MYFIYLLTRHSCRVLTLQMFILFLFSGYFIKLCNLCRMTLVDNTKIKISAYIDYISSGNKLDFLTVKVSCFPDTTLKGFQFGSSSMTSISTCFLQHTHSDAAYPLILFRSYFTCDKH